jgi:hypothetical protein
MAGEGNLQETIGNLATGWSIAWQGNEHFKSSFLKEDRKLIL